MKKSVVWGVNITWIESLTFGLDLVKTGPQNKQNGHGMHHVPAFFKENKVS